MTIPHLNAFPVAYMSFESSSIISLHNFFISYDALHGSRNVIPIFTATFGSERNVSRALCGSLTEPYATHIRLCPPSLVVHLDVEASVLKTVLKKEERIRACRKSQTGQSCTTEYAAAGTARHLLELMNQPKPLNLFFDPINGPTDSFACNLGVVLWAESSPKVYTKSHELLYDGS